MIITAGFATGVTEIQFLNIIFKMPIGFMAKNNISAQYSAIRTAPFSVLLKTLAQGCIWH